MSITSKKIINSLLLIALVALIAALAYRFTGGERRLLTGSILAGIDSDYINSIEFINPSGTAFPINNEVTIDSISVDFKECEDFDFAYCPTSDGCIGSTSSCVGSPTCIFPADATCTGGCQTLCEDVLNCSWDTTFGCSGDFSCANLDRDYCDGIGDNDMGGCTEYSQIYFSEIAWMGTTANADDEWIELYNPNSFPVDLLEWTIKGSDSGFSDIQLNGTIAPYGYFLLERTDDTTINDIIADQIYTGADLVDLGMLLELVDPIDRVIDQVDAWYAGDNTLTRVTMARSNFELSGLNSSAWCTSSSNSFYINGLDSGPSDIFGTPKQINHCATDPGDVPIVGDLTSCTGTPTCDIPVAGTCNDFPGCTWTIGDVCVGDFDYEDTTLQGSIDLIDVIFDSADLPMGATISNNEIIVPDIFDDFDLNIYLPGYSAFNENVNIQPLNISSIDCSYLSASLMMATGEGVFTGDPSDLPDPAVSETFDFVQTISTGQGAATELDFDDLYTPYSRDLKQLIIQNPVYTGPTFGSKLFTLTVDFNGLVTDYQVDVCTGNPGCEVHTTAATCTGSCIWSPCNMNTSDSCTITVEDDLTLADTVHNFVDAIEAIENSAFSASSAGNLVTLTATEEGLHTNAYIYNAIFDNLSAQECTGLAEPLCDSTSGCDYVVVNACIGTATADCESFQSDQPACENADISGCLWTSGGACSGDFDSCAGLGTFCEIIPGCGGDCSGTPTCASATTQIMCEDELLNGCTWESCTGTATACSVFDGDKTGCDDQAGCSWDDPLCKATATLCGDISDEAICGTQDGCTWGPGSCTGTPVCDDFVGPSFELCIMADACLPTTYPCDGTLSASCEDFSDTSTPTCSELGCDWVPCIGTPCDGLGMTECIDDTDSAECTWDGSTCSMSNYPEFILECSDLGGCFADGADNDPLSITNIILTNTSSNPYYEPAHQTFNLVIDFDTTISGQAVQSGSTITVKDEGPADTQGTALNFAYVFNTLLGIDSPFFASFDPLNTSGIILTTRELGTHTNYYTCNVNGSPFPDSTAYCFSGGDVGALGVDVLVAPTTLDNSITQGEVVLVYASGSVGDNIWLSSDPSIIEVAPLNEIGDIMDGSSASFLVTPLIGTEDVKVYEGTYTKGVREDIYNDAPTPLLIETRYPITMTIPVEYDVTSPLVTLVTVGGDVYDVPVDVVGNLYGNLTGSGTWSDIDGLDILLNGTLSGIVQGYASGDVEGMVHGPVSVDITANATMLYTFIIANLGTGMDVPTVPSVSSSGSIEADGTFTSTITEVQEISTDVAVLYAKRPGTTLLHVSDAHNCTATLSVTTVPLEVILQMASADPSDIFDVGDDVQIEAYIGTAGGDFSTMDEITADSQIEWFSGNSVVADFTANDGLLSILAPGTTNVTAHYDTGQAEIGTIESDIMPIVVDKIEGLTITLNEATQAAMPAAERDLGYQNVYLEIHNPQAVGSSVTIEGQTINIVLPSMAYANDLEKVSAIAADIAGQISTTVTVTQSTTYPGVLSLLPHSSDANGIVDISSTAPVEKVTIVPNFGNNIVLPPSKTYGLMVVAEYQSGKTKRLSPGSVSWINNPLNLDDAKLLSGLLESDVYEDSTVEAEFVNADASTAPSNVLTITVHSGPVIEFVRRIGVGSILGGDTVDLQVKVTDVDTIADISELNVLLAKSAYNTYDDIIANPVDYFSVESYLVDVVVEEEVDGTVTPVPEPSFKTYEIPVYIPQSTGLFDGDYKLLIEITDMGTNVVRAVYPIYIGEVATGDVNGDGNITMIDVYFAFQIYSGAVVPTQAQLEAANMDGIGGVTIQDVVLLFQQVSST